MTAQLLPYTFVAIATRKVVDAAGIVHDVRDAPPDRTYRRETCCTSATWYLLEPIVSIAEGAVTTCLQCLGTKQP